MTFVVETVTTDKSIQRYTCRMQMTSDFKIGRNTLAQQPNKVPLIGPLYSKSISNEL